MKTQPQKSKKLRASVLAGTLAVAMVLTGTFAWRSISQKTRNEILDERNPGGRVHDDFSFNETVKNKDVYAENFTDEAHGAPIFARIKLLEYMETGADAGINRDAATGRKATPLVRGAEIESTDTWMAYDPTDTDSPFRDYWRWEFGGKTAYMPTFNKNKDSLSVDVNGTYGTYDETTKEFKDGFTPYSDYKTYTAGETTETDYEYYDADEDIDDEYYKDHVGGPDGNGGVLGTDYSISPDTVTHTAQETLNSDGYILMSEWIEAGKPVCNTWVYDDTKDDSGNYVGGNWFYWPEPIQPQTATGLLLTNVVQRKTASEKSYYAIEVVGEFASDDPVKGWGDKDSTDDIERGFYLNGFSDKAKELMDQAASVAIGREDGKWYLPVEGTTTVYREILDDAGKLSAKPISAGMDGDIGTGDDRADVETYTAADAITIGDKTYGKYYLPPTAEEPYYRVSGDGTLGTEADTFYWVKSTGGSFPDAGAVTTEPVTSITVAAADGKTTVKNGSPLTFTATVETAGDALTDTSVTWSVSGNENPGTTIDDAGKLTVVGETEGTKLTVTATSKLDPRKSAKADVKVVDKDISVAISGPAEVHADSFVSLSASLSGEDAGDDLSKVSWSFVDGSGSAVSAPTGLSIDASGTDGTVHLKADTTAVKDTMVYVKATYTDGGKAFDSAPHGVKVLEKSPVEMPLTLTSGGASVAVDALEAGADLTLGLGKVTVDGAEATVTETAWSVAKVEAPATLSLRAADETTATITGSTLHVGKRVRAGTVITVQCDIKYEDPTDHATKAASASTTLTVAGPDTVTITNSETKVAQNSTLQMKASVTKGGKAYAGDGVTWSMTGNSVATIDPNTGVLTVGAEGVGKTLSIVATSVVDGTVQSVAKELTVVGPTGVELTSPAAGVTTVVQGGTVTFAAKVKGDGGDFLNQEVTWSLTGKQKSGTSFNSATGVLTVARDEPVGTNLTVTATSVADTRKAASRTLTVTGPDSVVFTSPTAASVNGTQGKTVSFAAEARLNGARYTVNPGVTWSVSGKTSSGTSISTAGVLTIAADEARVTLTVKATSVVDTSKYAIKTVKVVPDWTKSTVTLDGIQFYVLYRDNTSHKALLLSKDALMKKIMDASNTTHWHQSDLRDYLNQETSGGWLYGKTEINSYIQETTIKTRQDVGSTAYDEDKCKVFLLSQADVYGKQWGGGANGAGGSDQTAVANDYTVPGVKLTIPGGNWVANYSGSAIWSWLRSPRYSSNGAAGVNTDGNISHSGRSLTDGGVRPAFWVKTS